jgi:hypothetical protein
MYQLDPYLTNILMRDLVGHDRRPAAFLVYLWFTAEQQNIEQQNVEQQNAGRQNVKKQHPARQPRSSAVSISYQDLAESIGISKSSAQSAVAWLIRRKLLASSKTTVTATPEYDVLTPWKRESRRPATR